jgi:hypothetical protein
LAWGGESGKWGKITFHSACSSTTTDGYINSTIFFASGFWKVKQFSCSCSLFNNSIISKEPNTSGEYFRSMFNIIS